MQSSKKISKIVLMLSLVAAFSFSTIAPINGILNQNFPISEQYQLDYDFKSIIQIKDDGGGGDPNVIIQSNNIF